MISIVIPAYNEEERIYKPLMSLASALNKKGRYEIIVVSDGWDGTAETVKSARNLNIKVIERRQRLGKGGAIALGFQACKGEVLGFLDADGATSIPTIMKMIDEMKMYDAVIASRRVKGAKIIVKPPLGRRISSMAYNILVNLIFGLEIKDTQCGAKLFRKDVIDTVLPEIVSSGFEFDTELLWRIKKRGYTTKEFPATWTHKEKSEFQLTKGPGMILSLLKIRLMGK